MAIEDLFSPYPGFHNWALSEVFQGEPDPVGVYIPNVGDLVTDVPGNRIYKSAYRDITTGITTLVPWDLQRTSDSSDGLDVFISTGPGSVSESFRINLDSSVLPYELAFDDRVRMYARDAVYVKVFLGIDIEHNPIVISNYYNQSGSLQGENIPLETIPSNGAVLNAIKRPVIASCNRVIPDGEVVTAVVYGAAGGVLSTASFIVRNTRFIRGVSDTTKYVTGITLKTPFASPVDMRVINYPINVTVDSNSLIGVVHYNTGATAEYPVNGTPFKINGLSSYMSTQVGTSIPLVLSYQLGDNEMSYALNTSSDGVVSEPYRLVSTVTNGTYAVKLFGYPKWIDDIYGYEMEYWLFNLDRNIATNVTEHVTLANNSAAFDPKLYATLQTVTVMVDLNDVNSSYSTFNHSQTFTIMLAGPGSATDSTLWTIGYVLNQNPRYGIGAKAVATLVSGSNWNVDLSCSFASREVWLQKLYYDTHPLFDPSVEATPPQPTHVEVVFKQFVVEIPISNWNVLMSVPNDVPQGELLGLRWIRRTSNSDLLLAYSALPVFIV